MQSVIVTSYVDPDLDGLGSAVGYAEFLNNMGKKAVVKIVGVPHDEALYVLQRFQLAMPETTLDMLPFDKIVLVDTSELGSLVEKIDPQSVVEVIDHRSVHETGLFTNAHVQIELVGSAATLIAERFIETNMAISRGAAILMYGAIISNTLNFKASVTTERDKKAAFWLNEIAQLPVDFWKELFLAKSDLTGSKLKERIDGDFATFTMGDKKIGIAQIEMIGAKALIVARGDEIMMQLHDMKKEKQLDYIFQNTIDLEENKNYLVTSHEETRVLLENVLSVQFVGVMAERTPVLMRKQIVPLLKEELETKKAL